MNRDKVVKLLTERVDREFKTKRAAAMAIGISDTHLNRTLTGEYTIPEQVLDFLGLELKTTVNYVRVKKS